MCCHVPTCRDGQTDNGDNSASLPQYGPKASTLRPGCPFSPKTYLHSSSVKHVFSIGVRNRNLVASFWVGKEVTLLFSGAALIFISVVPLPPHFSPFYLFLNFFFNAFPPKVTLGPYQEVGMGLVAGGCLFVGMATGPINDIDLAKKSRKVGQNLMYAGLKSDARTKFNIGVL